MQAENRMGRHEDMIIEAQLQSFRTIVIRVNYVDNQTVDFQRLLEVFAMFMIDDLLLLLI